MIIFLSIYIAIGLLLLIGLTIADTEALEGVADSFMHSGMGMIQAYLLLDFIIVFGGVPMIIWALVDMGKDKKL